MRLWRTGDSGILVERSAGSFVLFALSGQIVRVFEPWGSSESDAILRMSYTVEGSELILYSDVEPDCGENTRQASSVDVRGLVPLAAEDCWVPLADIEITVARFLRERER
jgi:hypothetical protein